MILDPGARLGPYEIVSAIGTGGMGEVYKARDTRLDRAVALKVLQAGVATDAESRARFEREARAVAALDHPHICGVFDVGATDGVNYLVMPYLDGQTLAARLESDRLTLDQSLTIAVEIADALDKAHRHGITHRDLKPANIMLTRSGSKLLDFGLAKWQLPLASPSLSAATEFVDRTPRTAQGTILGTLQYMAPEQAEGKEADARSDIWALGAVIYEMVTGTRPFQGDTPASVISSILRDDPAPLSTRQPVAPRALERIVSVCLAKNPDDRWQSAGDVKRQLEWVTKAEPKTPAREPGRRYGIAAIAAPVVAAAAGAALMWFVQSPSESATPTDRPVMFTIAAPPGFSLAGPEASTSVPQLAVSPDGRHVVFAVADAEGRSNLWLRALDEPASRPLTGTERASDPFWSPDSRRVGFFSQGVIKQINIDGEGSPQTVSRGTVDPRGGAWNTDGTILFYASREAVLSRVTDTGGPVSEIPFIEAGMARWPEFLPDAEHVLFQVRDPNPDQGGIFVAPRNGDSSGSRRLIGSDWSARYGSGYLLFLDGSTLMAQPFDVTRLQLSGTPTVVARGVGGSSSAYAAFSVSTTGVLAYAGRLATQSELRWVDRSGRTEAVVAPKADYVDFSLSPDASRLAYARTDPELQSPDIWVLDFGRGTSPRITSNRLTDASPTWSPQGDQLVFRSNFYTALGVELYVIASSPGGTPRRIYGHQEARPAILGNILPCCWLPNGQLVFSQSTFDKGYGIWSSSTEGANPKPILETEDNELQAAISPDPDNRWLAYASDQSGRYEIYVQDFPGGSQRAMVSTKGGMQPRWRGDDGRELFYIQADGSLMQVTVAPGERFSSTAPKELFKTNIPTTLNPYRTDYVPAADGQRFLMKVPVAEPPPAITVVLDWPALLKRTSSK